MASEKPTSRRDFLRGRSAARAIVERLQSVADRTAEALNLDDPPGRKSPTAEWQRSGAGAHATLYASRRAMACEFAVEFHAADGAAANDAVLAALDLVDELETQLTIYRETSEVLEINRSAGAGPVFVEPQLFALLELCLCLHRETGGAFDLTSGPLSRLWGFLQREGRLPPDEDVQAALATVGANQVALDPAETTIAFRQPGVEINLNAVGKGYALDRVARLLVDRGMDDFLCHGGRSSVLARGRKRGDRGDGWRVGVPHPHDAGRTIGEITLRDEALGTSGAGVQFFVADGRRFGHLIDPRTGQPADQVYLATVVAASAAEADALSTAFYIMGPGDAAEYCAAHADVAAVLVCPRGAGELFDVHAFNVDDGRWQPR